MDEKILYGILVVAAAALLAFSALSLLTQPSSAQPQPGTGGSQPQGPRLQGSAPSECGDVTDPSNIQHLSHHPNLYGECYKYIDPAAFKAATGQDISNYLR